MTPLTLADELVLIAYGEKSGRPACSNLDHGVAAALLIELALVRRIYHPKRQTIAVHNTDSTGHDGLDVILEHLAECDATAPYSWLVATAGFVGQQQIRDELVTNGILRKRTAGLLGLIEWSTYPAGDDDGAEANAIRRINAAINEGSAEDARTALLCQLVGTLHLEKQVTGTFTLSKHLSLRETLREILPHDNACDVTDNFAAIAILRALRHHVRMVNVSVRDGSPSATNSTI